ncbi:uncharacterized protein [Pocillopora verrucosa]|uniref:uncharacterized protein n=1 Tax=Pocillopora verrucosa TaxID=203993 RepID=UPI003340ECC5
MESFADSMNVLGLEDCPDGNQNLVYEEFKEQLVRSPKGWYVSCLLWKVVRETAESTKIHIIYGGPARSSKSASSLDECSETGPPSQNKLWSVLARNRFYPVVQAGDLKQWFLQVRTREGERDTMRFHWLKDLETKQAEPLRFTRALFGISTSPFHLGGVIDQHL